MRVFNENKTKELTIDDIDESRGVLKNDIIITHFDEQEAVEEVFHYEVIKEYPNGGKDVEKVIDIEGKPYIPAHDDVEDVYIYIPYTDEELNNIKLNNERSMLQQWFKTNYTEYEQMFTRRKALGIEDTIVDEFRNKTYHNLIELYEEAEVVAKEIRELRK